MKAKELKTLPERGRKLNDYPSIPDTPPPELKKDKEVVALEGEQDREKAHISALQKENNEIEEILQKLEEEIRLVKGNFPQNLDGDGRVHADNEYWFRYEAQMEVNRKLEKEKRHLESEIRQMEEQGTINLDSLTQSELILYVKQLERTKTDLLSELRAKEWSLDKQAKDYHHLNETKRTLEAEIRHYDGEHALYRHYKRTSCPSANRQSSESNSARKDQQRGKLKSKESRVLKKTGSISHENIVGSSTSKLMFRSLDENKLEDLKTRQRRTDANRKKTEKKEPEKMSTVSLPELSKKIEKASTPPKTVRSKSEYNVGTVRSRPGTGSSIRIVVTDESESWNRSERSFSEHESGIGSPSEDHEDDFESDVKDVPKTRRRPGSATWRI